MNDTISRKAAIDALTAEANAEGAYGYVDAKTIVDCLTSMPSAQPEGWMEKNKERILQAGMEGREIEFRIGGRLFAIREKAQ